MIVTGTILPAVVLGPFLGVYVDRWDRRRTLIATNVVQAVVVAALSGLVLTGEASLSLLFGLVLLLGTGATVVRTATGAIVPTLVAVEDLPPANGLLSVSGSLNQVVGLSLGGIVVALFHVAAAIEYDALTFAAAAALLLLIPATPRAARDPSQGPPPRFREELGEGLRFIRAHRFMLEIIAIGVIVNFFGNGLAAVVAPYASFVLHGGAEVYGFLGAGVAFGAFVGAALVGRADLRASVGRYTFLGGLGIGGSVLGLGLVGTFPLAMSLMLALGATLSVTNVPISVAIQAKVPSRLLGRVGAAFGALVSATGPAGPLFAGWLAQRWSVPGVFLLSGLVIVLVMGLGALTMTSLRSLRY